MEFCEIDPKKVLLKSVPTLREPVESDQVGEIVGTEADAPSLPVDPYRHLPFILREEDIPKVGIAVDQRLRMRRFIDTLLEGLWISLKQSLDDRTPWLGDSIPTASKNAARSRRGESSGRFTSRLRRSNPSLSSKGLSHQVAWIAASDLTACSQSLILGGSGHSVT